MAANGDRTDALPPESVPPKSMPPGPLPKVIALESASNLRDIGGWAASAGQVRQGVAFRSGALDRLSPADQAALCALGVKTVCDFRGVAEAAIAPSRLDQMSGIECFALPIEPSVGASLRDIARTREATGEDVASLMRRAYTAYALECGQQFRALFDLLLENGRTPLLFHCSAGKDRTGFAAALLLTAVGVPWDLVMQDYLATNQIWSGDERLAAELPQAAAAELLRVSPNYLETGFAALKREYGSIDRYMERVLGLAPRRRDRLLSLLLA